jgi:hypothetical protein
MEAAVRRVREFIGPAGRATCDQEALPDRTKRFPDGAQYRVEIPRVEGPDMLETVLAEPGAPGTLKDTSATSWVRSAWSTAPRPSSGRANRA